MENLEVGQVWATGDGKRREIVRIDTRGMIDVRYRNMTTKKMSNIFGCNFQDLIASTNAKLEGRDGDA